MLSLEGTIKAAKEPHPDLYQRHQEIGKELARVRDALRPEPWIKTKEKYYDAMSTIELDKQIDQFLDQKPDMDTSDTEDEDWNPPIPEYVVAERARIVEAYYGPEAETLEGPAALA